MGLPGLDKPILLHSSRHDHCKLTAEQCAWRGRTWLYWYQADYDYGYGTVYFVVVLIALFAIAHLSKLLSLARRPRNQTQTERANWVHRVFAGLRYFSYRVVTIRWLGWYSPAIGIVLIGCAAWVYFGILTLAPKPYYWPNTEEVNYGNSPPIATRTGWMAVALLPFNVAAAAKWNLITVLTGVSHERLQVFHRWSSWLMFVLALIHTFPFIVYHIDLGDMVEKWNNDVFYWTGVAALVPQAWLNIMSIGFIRNRFYETFKSLHYVAAALFIVFFFLHCDFRLTSWDYFIALAAVYGFSLLVAWGRGYIVNGFSHRASFENQTDQTVRMSIPTNINWHPGQHVFVRFATTYMDGALSMNSLTSHPFSICSLPESDTRSSRREMLFYIRPHSGITRRMYEFAEANKGSTLPVQLDGPYGGVDPAAFDGFGRVLIIAGGSGAGAVLPLIEKVVRRAPPTPTSRTDGAVEAATTLDVQLYWVIRHIDSFEWLKEPISQILSIATRANVRVSVHVTRETESATSTGSDTAIPEKTVEVEATPETESQPQPQPQPQADKIAISKDGKRPDLSALIQANANDAPGPVAIAACGPSTMLYDVRNAAAAAQVRIFAGDSSSASQVWLHTENFGW